MLLAGAIVGFSKTSYTVSEDDGEVEICASVRVPNIPLPVNFPFDLQFETSDHVAGKKFYVCMFVHKFFFACNTYLCNYDSCTCISK